MDSIEVRTATALATVPRELLIAGEWRSTTKRVEVVDPASGAILADVADAEVGDAEDALSAAAAAQRLWSTTDPRYRAEILRTTFDLIQERSETFALLMTLEMGKPIGEARAEVAYGSEYLRWFSEEAVRVAGRYAVAPSGGTRLLTMKQAVGPVYAITPWNFPLAMGTRKIGPAFAAGCTVIIKPASATPLTTLALAQAFLDAGLPKGVLNVLTTSSSGPVSSYIIADPRLRKVTFTGSTSVGRNLIKQSASQVLKVSMELGGNAPFLVFPDADLDAAVDGAVTAKMRNVGEACTAANRFIVHSSVAENFATRFADRIAGLRVGPGSDESVQVGALIDGAAVDNVESLVEDAVARGGEVLAGGKRLAGPGSFYEPTVIAKVSPQSRVFTEEIFGPVAPITTFETDEEAIELANRTEYGLVGYVFTQNLSRALTVTERLETGMVAINQGTISNPAAPFGGVKASGLGREGGHEGIEEYLETKYVGIALAPTS